MNDLLKLGDSPSSQIAKINTIIDGIPKIDDGTKGLSYALYADNLSMVCTGMGTVTDQTISIASIVDGLRVSHIGIRAFADVKNLLEVIIPDSVGVIEASAFTGCTNLMSVIIPNSVTAIKSGAFSFCKNLNDVKIPANMVYIDDNAFNGCSKLEVVEISDNLTSIEAYAFANCTALNKIKFNGTIEEWQAIKFGSEWDNGTGDYYVYCLDGKIAKDGSVSEYAIGSTADPVTRDINGAMQYLIPQERKATVPSFYSVEYAVREAMPVYIPISIFAKGKDLYPSTHADYNKMIFVGNARGWNMTVGNSAIVGGVDNLTKIATTLAKLLDRGYIISNVTQGMYNPLVTHVEYSWSFEPVDGNVNDKVKVHTIKVEVDASLQDSLTSALVDTGGYIWLQQSLPYYMQQYYID